MAGEEKHQDIESAPLSPHIQRGIAKTASRQRSSSSTPSPKGLFLDKPKQIDTLKPKIMSDEEGYLDIDDDKYREKSSTPHYFPRRKSRRPSNLYPSPRSLVGSGPSTPLLSHNELPYYKSHGSSVPRFRRRCWLVSLVLLCSLMGFLFGYIQGSFHKEIIKETLVPFINQTLPTPKELDPIQELESLNMVRVPLPTAQATPDPSKRGTDIVSNVPASTLIQGTKRWDRFAVCLKTGSATAVNRVPIQLMTFLKDVNNILLIGEAPGVFVGNREMVDVCSRLYDASQVKPMEWDKIMAHRKPKSPASPLQSDGSGKIIPDMESLGWKLDAHKNLPGIKLLYETYPQADWYLVMDDDTYMFLENIEEALRAYDPSKPIYAGTPSMFKGCDGVQKMGDGPMFAHGGSGIILSRGAVVKLLKQIPECIIKYRDCWAGDVRLALCLRDVDIKITMLPMESVDPPGDDYSFPMDACAKPISYHHLLPTQMQKLYNSSKSSLVEMQHVYNEWKKTASPSQLNLFQPSLLPNLAKITTSDVYQQWKDDLTLLESEQDVNREGGDYVTAQVENYTTCRDFCKSQPACTAWSWLNKKCLLKNGIPKRVAAKGYYSGVFAGKYKCQRELKL